MIDADDKLRVEPRERIAMTAQTVELSDFEGNVMFTTPLLGAHLESVRLGRLFLVAGTAAAGVAAGAVGVWNLYRIGDGLMTLAYLWVS